MSIIQISFLAGKLIRVLFYIYLFFDILIIIILTMSILYPNSTPMSPPGTKIVICDNPIIILSLGVLLIRVWYIITEPEHYWLYTIFVNKTSCMLVAEILELFPKNFNMPFSIIFQDEYLIVSIRNSFPIPYFSWVDLMNPYMIRKKFHCACVP